MGIIWFVASANKKLFVLGKGCWESLMRYGATTAIIDGSSDVDAALALPPDPALVVDGDVISNEAFAARVRDAWQGDGNLAEWYEWSDHTQEVARRLYLFCLAAEWRVWLVADYDDAYYELRERGWLKVDSRYDIDCHQIAESGPF